MLLTALLFLLGLALLVGGGESLARGAAAIVHSVGVPPQFGPRVCCFLDFLCLPDLGSCIVTCRQKLRILRGFLSAEDNP